MMLTRSSQPLGVFLYALPVAVSRYQSPRTLPSSVGAPTPEFQRVLRLATASSLSWRVSIVRLAMSAEVIDLSLMSRPVIIAPAVAPPTPAETTRAPATRRADAVRPLRRAGMSERKVGDPPESMGGPPRWQPAGRA